MAEKPVKKKKKKTTPSGPHPGGKLNIDSGPRRVARIIESSSEEEDTTPLVRRKRQKADKGQAEPSPKGGVQNPVTTEKAEGQRTEPTTEPEAVGQGSTAGGDGGGRLGSTISGGGGFFDFDVELDVSSR